VRERRHGAFDVADDEPGGLIREGFEHAIPRREACRGGRPVRAAGVSDPRLQPPVKVGDEIAQITSAMVEVARRAGSRRL
jgi:hypothetical protein